MPRQVALYRMAGQPSIRPSKRFCPFSHDYFGRGADTTISIDGGAISLSNGVTLTPSNSVCEEQ